MAFEHALGRVSIERNAKRAHSEATEQDYLARTGTFSS
jgi:hypothetical protein